MSSAKVVAIRRRYLLLLGLRWVSVGLLLPLLVLIARQRGLSLTEVGLVLAAYGITVAVLELPTGGLADSMGRRNVLVLSAALQLVFYAVVLTGTSTGMFLVGFMIGGAARALDSGPLEAWFVDRTSPAATRDDLRRGLASGGIVSGLALSLGAVAGGLLPAIGDQHMDLSIWAALATGAVYLISLPLLMQEDSRSAAESLPTVLARVPRVVAAGFRLGLGETSVRLLLSGMAGLGFALAGLELLWQPRFVELLDGDRINTGPLGFVLAAAFAVGALGSALAPRVTTRLGGDARRTVFVGRFFMGSAVLVLAAAGRFEIAVIALIGAYFANGIAGPIESELLHERVDERVRTTMLSIQSMTLQGGGLAAGLGLGALADTVGIPAAWYLAGAVSILSSFLYLRVRSIDPGRPPVRPDGPIASSRPREVRAVMQPRHDGQDDRLTEGALTQAENRGVHELSKP